MGSVGPLGRAEAGGRAADPDVELQQRAARGAALGPVAQNFYATLHVDADGTHINPVDFEGVALATNHGLNQLVQVQQVEIVKLKGELSAPGHATHPASAAPPSDGILPALVALSLLMNRLPGMMPVAHLRKG